MADPTATERRRATAERQRRKRDRDRRGLKPFRVDLPGDLIAEAVIDAGLITEDQAVDHQAVERALEIFVRHHILCNGVTLSAKSRVRYRKSS